MCFTVDNFEMKKRSFYATVVQYNKTNIGKYEYFHHRK